MNLFCWHKDYDIWLTLQFTGLKDDQKEFGRVSRARYVELNYLNQTTYNQENVWCNLFIYFPLINIFMYNIHLHPQFVRDEDGGHLGQSDEGRAIQTQREMGQ